MIQYLNWLTELESFEQVDCIENELLIFRYSELIDKILQKSPYHRDTMRNPHKFDFFVYNILFENVSGKTFPIIN